MTYSNGLAPNSALVFINGIHVVPSVQTRVLALVAFAATQGRKVYVVARYGGYRQRAPLTPEQEAVYAAGATGGSTVTVAKPGTSTHGVYDEGRVDLGDLPTGYTKSGLAWIVANAGQFGLVREFGSADPNHFIASGAFSGGNVTPLPGQGVGPALEEDMNDYWAVATSDDGMVGKDQRFVQGPDGPLRCLSGVGGNEWAVREAQGATPVQWSGNQISALIGVVGLYEYAYDPTKPGGVGRLTGRIIYAPSEVRDYPKVTAVNEGSSAPAQADTAAIVSGVVGGVLASIPKPPTEFTITGKATS